MHNILSDNLEKYLEGRLPAALEASLDSHLAECHGCRESLNEAMESHQLLNLFAVTSEDPAPEPAPGFAIKVMQGIADTKRPSIWSMLFTLPDFPIMRQLTVAALMLLVLTGGYAYALRATTASPTAEMLVDWSSVREAPASGFAHQHKTGDMCLRCWKSSSVQVADSTNNDVREVALATLASDSD